jgi:RimJ/RimL family protein N-acetyltransferase
VEIPKPSPRLADEVVTLRPWRTDDAAVLARAWADPDIRRWCSVPAEATEDGARRWIAGADDCRRDGLALDLAIEVDGQVVGEVGLGPIQWAHERAAVGFWVDAAHRRDGHAAKALRLLAPWAFEHLPLDTLAAESSTENPASGRTLRAAAFTLATEHGTRQAWIRTR